MLCTMFWHGGSSYAVFDTHNPRDAEEFRSIKDAKDAFWRRLGDRYYPCVSDAIPDDGGPEAWLFLCPKRDAIGQDYPDRIIKFGPRGGVIVEPA